MVEWLFNIDFLLLGIAVAGNLILGFVVFLNQRKGATSRLFLAFTIVNSMWSLVTYFSYAVTEKQMALWLVRLVIFFAIIHSSLFFLLVNAFPGQRLRIEKRYLYIVMFFVTLAMVLSLSPFIFKDIDFTTGKVPQPKLYFFKNPPAPLGVMFFLFTIFSTILGGIVSLIARTIKSSGIEKKHYKLLLIGATIMFASILLFDVFFPLGLQNASLIPLSALFTLPFVFSIYYAMIRYKLFNIRIAGVAVLVFGLSIAIFVDVTGISLLVVRSAELFLVLLFGILLIRSVLKEVRQREEIAQMAEDVRKAYVIEKKAKEELQKIDKIKDQFLLITQHDLRRPLTSVKWFLNMLLRGILGKQNKKTVEGAKRIQDSVDSSIEEVNNFLDIAQFQMGKSGVVLKPGVELLLILENIFNKLKPQAEEKGIYLKFDKPAENFVISADAVKLKTALLNIVDNAIKYTNHGGVTIKLEIRKQPSGVPVGPAKLEIIVSDTGIGIPKDKVNAIFENMFERTEEAKRTTTMGKGIGLYLSSQIIGAHRGRIWAESEGEGRGSTFYIELPIS